MTPSILSAGHTAPWGGIKLKTIVVLGQKGGSGKTTLTINLAVAAAHRGLRVCILDTDPQRSTSQWFAKRVLNRVDENLSVTQKITARSCVASLAQEELSVCRRARMDIVLIDTPPHSTPTATRLAHSADLVVVPCRPAAMDMGTIEATGKIIDASGANSVLVLSACPPRCHESYEARDALQRAGWVVSPVHLGERMAYRRSVAHGMGAMELHGRRGSVIASEEVIVLWDWIEKALNADKKPSKKPSR